MIVKSSRIFVWSSKNRRNLKPELEAELASKSVDSIDKFDEESVSGNASLGDCAAASGGAARVQELQDNGFGKWCANEASDVQELQLSPSPLHTSSPVKYSGKQKINPFEEKHDETANGFHETHFDWRDTDSLGLSISKNILDEVVEKILNSDIENVDFENGELWRYDDRKNPFMDEVYDDSLLTHKTLIQN